MESRLRDLEYAFESVEISSGYLERMVDEVLTIMSKSLNFDEVSFGPLVEGRTNSGEAGAVTGDGDIYLDSDQLRHYDDDVAMAIIAHEFAHHYLGHYSSSSPSGLYQEDEADALAKEWGFDIPKFRRVCGPATIQNLTKIAG